MFDGPPRWTSDAGDPNDETFGDVTRGIDPEEADGFEAVLVGEPYDGAVIGRTGASEGPEAIREALAATKTHHFDAGPVDAVGDLGDVEALSLIEREGSGPGVARVQERVREATERVHDADALPVFLGGDNSLTYPNVAPLLDDAVGVVNLDAHLDVREVRDEAGPTSGTPYRQLFEAGLDAYGVVGARHFETSTRYHEYCRHRGAAIVTAEEVGDDPVEAADRALDAVDDVDRLYVSVDCDVLDAGAAPGVSAPTPGGITTRELFRTLRLLAADDRLAGVEVVECAPPLDRDDRTAKAAARAVAHVLSAAGAADAADGGDRP